ncbi:MAG: DEAD/DEAH box helicase [Candidatus Woesearchaeota archaeon]
MEADYSIGFQPREYQSSIAKVAVAHNTLIVLPTGLGKTNIFIMTAIERLKQHPKGKILLLGPTRPLIEQYYNVFSNLTKIEKEEMCILTGRVSPAKRKDLYDKCRLVFSTPQGLENDLITRKISLKEVVLLGIDEAHRTVGEYSYVWISKQYIEQSQYPRICAMTASPGSKEETIKEILHNLTIEKIETRTHDDPDVKPYVSSVKIVYEYVDVPKNLTVIIDCLKKSLTTKIRGIGEYLGEPVRTDITRKELLETQAKLQGSVIKGNADFRVRKALSLSAEAMKVQHALELAETQGVYSLKEYFEDLFVKAKTTKTKATQNLIQDHDFRTAYAKTITMSEENPNHPKLVKLKEIITNMLMIDKDSKAMIFNNYRSNAQHIVEEIRSIPGAKPELFVGQAKRKGSGLSQKDQKAVLDKFRSGEHNIIVSTSIGEEGLDIPKVDTVIFYEPVPSAIRSIQRRGRTGRNNEGRVIILVTKNTRDEAYVWSTRHKEKSMKKTIQQLNGSIAMNNNGNHNTSLNEYITQEDIKIIVDSREKSNSVLKELSNAKISIEMRSLDSADFILSDEVTVEYKEANDFLQSIIDGRLMSQARLMRRTYPKPIMIIEGFEDIYNLRNLHPNAIRGAISSIAIDFGITIIPSKNPKDTAGIMITIAKREQLKGNRPYSLHGIKEVDDIRRIQEYIVSSLPGIGPGLAPSLLEHFKTIRNIANANKEELSKVDKIGKKKAESIEEVFGKEYDNRV